MSLSSFVIAGEGKMRKRIPDPLSTIIDAEATNGKPIAEWKMILPNDEVDGAPDAGGGAVHISHDFLSGKSNENNLNGSSNLFTGASRRVSAVEDQHSTHYGNTFTRGRGRMGQYFLSGKYLFNNIPHTVQIKANQKILGHSFSRQRSRDYPGVQSKHNVTSAPDPHPSIDKAVWQCNRWQKLQNVALPRLLLCNGDRQP
ncbi:hypothetical protein B0H10DRAFT_1951306 [Mycena sp. CBHHK59/15]|nr:hypothetical protein B0H10DRAFT_1951306 [Mycena sp. CBHHK59/15]